MWEMLTIGFEVPQVLLPAPSLIGVAFANSLEMLWADFQQTFLKAVLAGFFMGCMLFSGFYRFMVKSEIALTGIYNQIGQIIFGILK